MQLKKLFINWFGLQRRLLIKRPSKNQAVYNTRDPWLPYSDLAASLLTVQGGTECTNGEDGFFFSLSYSCREPVATN